MPRSNAPSGDVENTLWNTRVEVRERHGRADRDRQHVRQELAIALLDDAASSACAAAHLPLAGSSVTRPNAPSSGLPSIWSVPVRLPSTRGGGTFAAASSASECRRPWAARRRADRLLGRRGHARRRALAKRRRERCERVGTDEELADENSCSARFLLPPSSARLRLVEQVGGLAERCGLLACGSQLALRARPRGSRCGLDLGLRGVATFWPRLAIVDNSPRTCRRWGAALLDPEHAAITSITPAMRPCTFIAPVDCTFQNGALCMVFGLFSKERALQRTIEKATNKLVAAA